MTRADVKGGLIIGALIGLCMGLFIVTAPADAHSNAEVRRDVREARLHLRQRMRRRQYRCLFRLWENESHWRVRAGSRRLASGGAFGIPQAVPGRKMRSAGRDWRTNAMTQVRWGRRYIRARYGSPCRALRFQNQRGWY